MSDSEFHNDANWQTAEMKIGKDAEEKLTIAELHSRWANLKDQRDSIDEELAFLADLIKTIEHFQDD